MNEVEFDQALSNFLEQEGCEQAGEALFQLVRMSFTAGWNAALGSDLKQVVDVDRR